MTIIACGLNHKTAPIALREKVVFSLEKMPLYLNDLLQNEDIHEAVLLSTCNRSELYCKTANSAKAIEWFCQQHQVSQAELLPVMYQYHDKAAIQHIMQVACGMDSMVLGESQILGQIKAAFSESCVAGTVGPLFNRLFQQVFSVAKEVRTNTAIGACPMSVASAAVGLAKQCQADLAKAHIVVIGSGDTIELVLRHLKSNSIQKLTIVSRNQENAALLAHHYNASARSLTELSDALITADIVISATGSALPIIQKSAMQAILAKRQQRPLDMIDLAVPRDIEPEVSDLPQVRLYCIDDLKAIISQNRRGREHAAEKAREVIEAKTNEFVTWLDSLEVVSTTIRAYRQQIEEMCQHELAKALRQLQRGDDPTQILTQFAHAFTNKLLHTPSVQLRQAGFEGRFDILRLAQQLFAISHPELEPL